MGLITENQLRPELQNKINDGANTVSELTDGASASMDTFLEVQNEFNLNNIIYSDGDRDGKVITFKGNLEQVYITKEDVTDSTSVITKTLHNATNINFNNMSNEFITAITDGKLKAVITKFDITYTGNLIDHISSIGTATQPVLTCKGVKFLNINNTLSINMETNISNIYESLIGSIMGGTYYIKACIDL